MAWSQEALERLDGALSILKDTIQPHYEVPHPYHPGVSDYGKDKDITYVIEALERLRHSAAQDDVLDTSGYWQAAERVVWLLGDASAKENYDFCREIAPVFNAVFSSEPGSLYWQVREAEREQQSQPSAVPLTKKLEQRREILLTGSGDTGGKAA